MDTKLSEAIQILESRIDDPRTKRSPLNRSTAWSCHLPAGPVATVTIVK
jgi:hypothetical protein